MQNQYSYLFKYIIIGDASVGKSCILMQFLENKFKIDSETTVGVEFGSKIIQAGQQKVKLQIWDTVHRLGKKLSNLLLDRIIGDLLEQYWSTIRPINNHSRICLSGQTRPKTTLMKNCLQYQSAIKRTYNISVLCQPIKAENLLREIKCCLQSVQLKMTHQKFLSIQPVKFSGKCKNDKSIRVTKPLESKLVHIDQESHKKIKGITTVAESQNHQWSLNFDISIQSSQKFVIIKQYELSYHIRILGINQSLPQQNQFVIQSN